MRLVPTDHTPPARNREHTSEYGKIIAAFLDSEERMMEVLHDGARSPRTLRAGFHYMIGSLGLRSRVAVTRRGDRVFLLNLDGEGF